MHYLKLSLLALSLMVPQGALAHTDEYLDTQAAPHGGQLRMAGGYHYELVVKQNEITVYLTDHAGTKLASQGAVGTATVLAGKTRTTVKLAPAGENRLKGNGKFGTATDMKVVVSVTMPGQPAQVARFTPFANRTAASGAEHRH